MADIALTLASKAPAQPPKPGVRAARRDVPSAAARGTFAVSMAARPPHAARLSAVEAGFGSLPERYLGADAGFDATWRIVLGDVGHTWEVRCTEHVARVRKGATNRTPDVVIGTDA